MLVVYLEDCVAAGGVDDLERVLNGPEQFVATRAARVRLDQSLHFRALNKRGDVQVSGFGYNWRERRASPSWTRQVARDKRFVNTFTSLTLHRA